MSKNFFEITNATFRVGGINKVNNVSFSIENEDIIFPIVESIELILRNIYYFCKFCESKIS